jgi:phosphatidyl-myo-inositol dimannoside synthase
LVKKIIPKSIILTVPLAVNQNFFKPLKKKKSEKLVFGTVSRILKFKGHDFILKTLKGLSKEQISKLEWHIAGTGPYLETLKKDVNELGLDKVVFFHGFLPDNHLVTFYNSLDCFILCTRQTIKSNHVEGFGLVFLEAQSCGVPVIGTNSGGIPSAVKHLNGGWLIEQDNLQELTELIKNINDNSIILKLEGIKARQRVEEECTWDLYCQQLFNILKQL